MSKLRNILPKMPEIQGPEKPETVFQSFQRVDYPEKNFVRNTL